MSIKILCLSDTHGLHDRIQPNWLPHADVLIHAGDVSNVGKAGEIDHFCNWFAGLKGYGMKVFIAGNHDFGFVEKSKSHKEVQAILSTYKNDIVYLQDSGVKFTKDKGLDTEEIINIWGSPWQPWFHDWAFNLQRGQELMDKWKLIPDDTHVLVTHGPAYGIGDFVPYGQSVGCEDLLVKTKLLPNLQAHIYGHIHYSYGLSHAHGYLQSVNACVCDEAYKVTNRPIMIEL